MSDKEVITLNGNLNKSEANNKENLDNSKQFLKFKLIYFEDRGKADLIRLIFAISNQSYEEMQIKQSDWTFYKSFMPFEQLPVLVINDDIKIAQANTICRFLSKHFNLNGANEVESLMCDMVVEQLKECSDQAIYALQETDKLRQSLLVAKFLNDTLAKTLSGYEKMLNMNSGRYIVGSKLTWADLAIVNSWEWLDETSKQLINRYPLVKKHYDYVRNIAQVSEWFSRQRPLRVNKRA